MATSSTRYPPGMAAGLTVAQTAAIADAVTHDSFAPGAVDYVLDEVQAIATAVAVYNNAASATLLANTVTVGPSATCLAVDATAVGSAASADSGATGAIAVGRQATVSDLYGVAVGATSTIQAGCTYAVAIGTAAFVANPAAGGVGTSAISIGYAAQTNADSSIAMGPNASAGDTASVKGTQSIAIGASALAGHDYDIAIGAGATSSTAQPDGISIGRSANSGGQFCIALGKSSTTSGKASICLGAGTSGSTFTDVIVLGSSNTGAVVAATTATANGDVIIGSGGSGAAGYLKGNQVTSKHLSPAAAGAVDLGQTATYFGKLYVDGVYPRTRATDFIYLSATKATASIFGPNGSTSYVHFPAESSTMDTGNVTLTLSATTAAGSVFSDGSSIVSGGKKVVAVKWTDPGYTQTALFTFHISSVNGGAATAWPRLRFGLGTSATALSDQADCGTYVGLATSADTCSPTMSAVITLTTGNNRYVGVMWKVDASSAYAAGTATATEQVISISAAIV